MLWIHALNTYVDTYVDTHTYIYTQTRQIEDMNEFFQIEVMTSSPSPIFFQIEDIAFWGRSAIISSIWKKGDQRSIFAVNCHEIPEKLEMNSK